MDEILFNRLKSTVIAEVGAKYDADLPTLVVTIMTFIENKIKQELNSSEKLALFEIWLKKLLADINLGGIEANTVTLIKGFVTLICQASKGQLDINVQRSRG